MNYDEYSLEDLAEEYNALERQAAEAREIEPRLLNMLARRLGVLEDYALASNRAEKIATLNGALAALDSKENGPGVRLDT